MEHAQFHIGLEFWCGDRQWRCTDIGTRTVIAIRIDSVEMTTVSGCAQSTRTFSRIEAEAEGLFSGPPYMIAESVFDENDLEGCELDREQQ